jgi:hypothetical protein
MVPWGSRCGGKHKRALLQQTSPADATRRLGTAVVEDRNEPVRRVLPGGGRSGGKHKLRLLQEASLADSTRRLLPGGGRQETANVPSGHRTAAASHSSKRPPMPRDRLAAPPARAGTLPHPGSSKP